MNKQGEGKIEYLDYTWNPISGCYHSCKDKYCYACKIATRFAAKVYKQNKDIFASDFKAELDIPVRSSDGRIEPFPYGFLPTFRKYRLNEPAEKRKPSIIGVVYMGDLFGDWVPYEWKYEVMEACQNAPRHTYIFLTKNPLGLENPFHLYFAHNEKFWIGTSVTRISELRRAQYLIDETTYKTNRFLSIEPLLGDMGSIPELKDYKWVIIGQQTGPGAIKPKPEWVQSIIDQARAAGVPVFVKSPLYKKFPIQEWPEGLRKEMET
jgi:protein gp37